MTFLVILALLLAYISLTSLIISSHFFHFLNQNAYILLLLQLPTPFLVSWFLQDIYHGLKILSQESPIIKNKQHLPF